MAPVLLIAFLVVPLAEIYVIVRIGEVIGVLRTIALLLAVSLAGAWLVRREGLRAWLAVRNALAEGRMPAGEVLDGALVLLGGALLLTPGFITDAVGSLLVVPAARAIVRRVARRWIAHRVATRRSF